MFMVISMVMDMVIIMDMVIFISVVIAMVMGNTEIKTKTMESKLSGEQSQRKSRICTVNFQLHDVKEDQWGEKKSHQM